MSPNNNPVQPDNMTRIEIGSHAQNVQAMFTRIAHKYELMNRLMTIGQDVHWRKRVIQIADVPRRGIFLDVGCGTGSLARYAARNGKEAHSVSVDFTPEMLRVGRNMPGGERLLWSEADGLSLPFSNNVFDSVVSGFFLRNTADVRVALIEQLRVLKPGGRVVILDTTRYTRSVVYPMVRFYTHTVIPLLGHLIAGNKEAYEYLSASTDRYFKAEDLAALMAAVGFEEICFERVMLDSVAIHWGRKQRQ